MNKLLVTASLVLFTILLSCESEFSEENLPPWLQEIVTENTECFGCSVTRYKYKGQTYYHYYCGIWSCMFCRLYNQDGQLVGVNFDFNDFLNHSKNEKVIWQCPGS